MNIDYLSLKAVTAQHEAEIKEAVSRVVESGWYLQGKETAAFEREYALFCGASQCVTCANGLDALTLTLRASIELGRLKEGDEVLVPANTYIATILSISENRLKPVLVEPSMHNFQIDDSRLEEAITERTKALMLVNLYGYDSFTERIGRLCKDHDLMLFVDNAQGHGLPLPVQATAVCHSFYPGKNLGALGDAGAMTTNDSLLAETFRTICNYGSSRKYVFDCKGRNSRMDELQAAVLRVKLKYLTADNARRREIAAIYDREIVNDKLTLPPLQGVHHIYPVLCADRDGLQDHLLRAGVHTMIHYPIPPHRQEAYAEWAGMDLPLTERIHREVLSLPCNQTMTDDEAHYVAATVNAF